MLPLAVEWSLPSLLVKLVVLMFWLCKHDEKFLIRCRCRSSLCRTHVVDDEIDLLNRRCVCCQVDGSSCWPRKSR